MSKRFWDCPDFVGCIAAPRMPKPSFWRRRPCHSRRACQPISDIYRQHAGPNLGVVGMRVLVTGYQGYLGTVMVPILQAAGHDVTGLDSGFFADCVLGPEPKDPPGMRVDLRDVSVQQLQGFDAVVHLAALSNNPLGALAPEVTYDINHHASVRLARLAKAAGVRRFLYASTCSVYGSAGEDLVTESAPLRPLTPYAESKVRVEGDVAAIADDSFLPGFLRDATAFGFSPRLRADIVLNN